MPGFNNPQALNRYAYALNNPLKYIDPLGYQTEEVAVATAPVLIWVPGAGWMALGFVAGILIITNVDNDIWGSIGDVFSSVVNFISNMFSSGPGIIDYVNQGHTTICKQLVDLPVVTSSEVADIAPSTSYVNKGKQVNDPIKDETPATDPDKFRPVRGHKEKQHEETGEIWQKDQYAHGGEHYEVYRNRKMWENGNRDRSVWKDGTLREKY